MLGVVPVLWRHALERVVDELELEKPVRVGGGREGRARIHLDQPRLERVVYDDVVPVELEAVAVVDHDSLAGLEGVDDDVVDVLKQLVRLLEAVIRLEVELERVQGPLAPVVLVVRVAVLLHRDVRQVHKRVVEVVLVLRVLVVAEAGKAQARLVRLQGPVRSHAHVKPKVELLPPNEKRVLDVLGHDVSVRAVHLDRTWPLSRVPLANLAELVDEEDAFPLRPRGGLEYPSGVGLAPVLLREQGIVARKNESGGHEVQDGRVSPLPLKLLPVPLHVLHHQVLPRDLVVVREVVDKLVVPEPHVAVRAKHLLSTVHARPVDVPVVLVRLIRRHGNTQRKTRELVREREKERERERE